VLAVLFVFSLLIIVPLSRQVSAAQISRDNRNEATEKLLSVAGSASVEEITRLIQEGADVNATDKDGLTTLMRVFSKNYLSSDILRVLIESGADVNAVDRWGKTPLMHAADLIQNPDVLQILIENGADVNAVTTSGFTPLMFAAIGHYRDTTAIIRVLIENGADVNAADRNGWTPLLLAARNNFDPDALLALIESGADVNAVNRNGKTSLMLATAYEGQISFMGTDMFRQNFYFLRILLDNGADPAMKDNEGRRAFDYAEENERMKAHYLSDVRVVGDVNLDLFHPWQQFIPASAPLFPSVVPYKWQFSETRRGNIGISNIYGCRQRSFRCKRQRRIAAVSGLLHN